MVTLKTLPEATAQEVFDQVANHLMSQGEQALERLTETTACRYRTGGLKCAAGCLIADDEYRPHFEGYTWGQLIENHGLPVAHQKLISQLQYIHDEVPVETWPSTLCRFAKENGLDLPDCLESCN